VELLRELYSSRAEGKESPSGADRRTDLIKPWLHSSFLDRTWTCNFPYFNKVREDPLTLVHISW